MCEDITIEEFRDVQDAYQADIDWFENQHSLDTAMYSATLADCEAHFARIIYDARDLTPNSYYIIATIW